MATKIVIENFCDACNTEAADAYHVHGRELFHNACCTRCVPRVTVTAPTCHCGSDTIGHVHTKGTL